MKKLLLIALLVVGCEEPKETILCVVDMTFFGFETSDDFNNTYWTFCEENISEELCIYSATYGCDDHLDCSGGILCDSCKTDLRMYGNPNNLYNSCSEYCDKRESFVSTTMSEAFHCFDYIKPFRDE